MPFRRKKVPRIYLEPRLSLGIVLVVYVPLVHRFDCRLELVPCPRVVFLVRVWIRVQRSEIKVSRKHRVRAGTIDTTACVSLLGRAPRQR